MDNLQESLKDILFGSIAGSTGKLIEYPFDTVKVRLQSQSFTNPIFKGPVDCFRQTYAKEGLIGFYRGLSSPLFGAAVENSALFFSYNNSIRVFIKNMPEVRNERDLPMWTKVASGGISGVVASFILTPVELVKCKLQVSKLYSTSQSTILSTIRGVIKNDGLKGLWYGQTGTILRESGGSASWFGTYEFISLQFRQLRYSKNGEFRDSMDKTNTTGELLIAGACAGISYNLSLFPADTIKSKMQTDSIIHPNTRNTFIQTLRIIYQNGGLRGFYRGLGISLIRALPSNAVIFFTYESLKKEFA